MQVSIGKLSLIVGLSLLLHISLLVQLRAQRTEDTDDPKFVQISPPNGTVIAATQVTITGCVEDASPVEVAVGDIKTKADKQGRFTLPGVSVTTGKNSITVVATDAAGNYEESERSCRRFPCSHACFSRPMATACRLKAMTGRPAGHRTRS